MPDPIPASNSSIKPPPFLSKFTWKLAHKGSIRSRLTTAIVLILILPLLIVVSISSLINTQSIQQRLFSQLDSLATLKESQVNNLLDNLQTNLTDMFSEDDIPRLRLVTLDKESTPDIILEIAHSKILEQLTRTQGRSEVYDEIFILGPDGTVVISTVRENEGISYADQPFFQEGLEGEYISPPHMVSGKDGLRVFASQPLPISIGQKMGVVVGLAQNDAIGSIFQEKTSLGSTGETYLIAPDYQSVTDSRAGQVGTIIKSSAILNTIAYKANGSGQYINGNGEPVLGVYRWIPQLQSVLLVEQTQQEAYGPIISAITINLGVSLISILIAVVVSLMVTKSIVEPIASLVLTTQEVVEGNLGLSAPIIHDDEVGALAKAFNRMAAQLRELVGELEQRVAERTSDLEKRNRQLQTAADVARDITMAKNLNELLNQAVTLIRDQFGFYHAGIFLIDERGEYAILQAATGEAGKQLLEREHKLKVGEVGLVGYVTGTGEPRIALDVGADAVHFKNPFLPYTRSEMALPLRASGGKIIGALDVQSVEESAFSKEDITIIQTMADQLAVAIENASLIEKMNMTLDELEKAYGSYTQQSWQRFTRQRGRMLGYRYRHMNVAPSNTPHPEAVAALEKGESIVVQMEQAINPEQQLRPAAIAVPIRLREQVIGVLNMRFGSSAISPETLSLAEEAASHLALVLENARLLEEARQRAEREQQLGMITGRMRQSLDIESVLKTAAKEIYDALGLQDVTIRLAGAAEEEKPRSVNKPSLLKD